MTVEMQKESIEEIKGLKKYLPEMSVKELEKILEYGEKIKAEGERKKKEFWEKYDVLSLRELVIYKAKHQKEFEGKYSYLNEMKGPERKQYIEKYLHDDMLYDGPWDTIFNTNFTINSCGYDEWKSGKKTIEEGIHLRFSSLFKGDEICSYIAKNLELKDRVSLNLSGSSVSAKGAKIIAENLKLKNGVSLYLNDNNIGDEGADAIAKMELKEGVNLNLNKNKIGDKGAISIAKNLKLKNCVWLILSSNSIGDEGAKAIAESLELKDGVQLELDGNNIGDEGAKALSNIKLKDGVKLDLGWNNIGDEGAEALSKMKLKAGTYLNLKGNSIGDEGAEAIMNNIELDEHAIISLENNKIGNEMKGKIKEWAQSYKNRGINCTILIDD